MRRDQVRPREKIDRVRREQVRPRKTIDRVRREQVRPRETIDRVRREQVVLLCIVITEPLELNIIFVSSSSFSSASILVSRAGSTP